MQSLQWAERQDTVEFNKEGNESITGFSRPGEGIADFREAAAKAAAIADKVDSIVDDLKNGITGLEVSVPIGTFKLVINFRLVKQ